MIYKPIAYYSKRDIDKAISDNDIQNLELIPLSVGEYCPNWRKGQKVCLLFLKKYDSKKIRANAVLGLSYIARNHRRLNNRKVLPFLKKEYETNKEYCGVICDAIEDIFLFLHWKQPKWWMDTERQ